jgi:hypothetical protein
MKLNQTQGKALAGVLTKQINDKIQTHNDLLEKKAKQSINTEKIKKEFASLKEKAKELSKVYSSYHLRELSTSQMVDSNIIVKVEGRKNKVSEPEIFNELILSTIECKDLEEIKSLIIKKFS